jgi:hypothetical protein
MARPRDDIGRLYLMEQEQHLDVGERGKACQGVRCKASGEGDAGLLTGPEIILGVRAHCIHEPDRIDFKSHDISPARPALHRVADGPVPYAREGARARHESWICRITSAIGIARARHIQMMASPALLLSSSPSTPETRRTSKNTSATA